MDIVLEEFNLLFLGSYGKDKIKLAITQSFFVSEKKIILVTLHWPKIGVSDGNFYFEIDF